MVPVRHSKDAHSLRSMVSSGCKKTEKALIGGRTERLSKARRPLAVVVRRLLEGVSKPQRVLLLV